VHLELGGNDATIVCEDADVAATAAALVAGRFTSGNGQICCAV
jgi:acyl-CoA reductase-like NAD-dependent aldehyde dehydrogenase